MAKPEVVVVSAARLPIGKHGGSYRNLKSEDVAILAVKAALGEAKFDVREGRVFFGEREVTIDQIIGTAPLYPDRDGLQHIYSVNIAQGVGLLDVPSYFVQRICGSGFQAVATAVDHIRAGSYQAVIVFGAESMTNAPLVSTAARLPGDVWKFGQGQLDDMIMRSLKHDLFSTEMARTAEEVAKRAGLTKADVDRYAAQSYERTGAAQSQQWNRHAHHPDENGYLRGVVVLDTIDRAGNHIVLARDEGWKPGMTFERIHKMPPFPSFTYFNAATASQVSDGAGALVLMERSYADSLGIPYDTIVAGHTAATCDPRLMGRAPVPAVERYLERTGTKLSNFDLFYVNEAFAAQVTGVIKELGLPIEITNPNGGAVAIGHPITATGACISVDTIHELRRRQEKRALATACIGGGQAVVIEYQRVK